MNSEPIEKVFVFFHTLCFDFLNCLFNRKTEKQKKLVLSFFEPSLNPVISRVGEETRVVTGDLTVVGKRSCPVLLASQSKPLG